MSDQTRTTSRPPRRASRRAGPLLAVFLVVAGTVGAFAPVTPMVRAEDATPTPMVEPTPEPTAEPTPEPTPEPTAEPTPEPTPEPTAEPTAQPSPEPSPEPTAGPTAEPSPGPTAEPSAEPSPDPTATPGEARVEHAWIDSVDSSGGVTAQGDIDTALDGAARFTVYRVRFQVVNRGDEPLRLDAGLEVRGQGGWHTLPFVDPVPGKPFYGASDDGRAFDPRRETIAAAELRLRDDLDPQASAVDGRSSAGRAIGEVTIPAHGFTELEFAVRATMDADWGRRYAFRLTDGLDPVHGAAPAELVMGGKPGLDLSPGQRNGKSVKDPIPLYRLDPTIGSTDLPIGSTTTPASAARFNLRGPVAAAAIEPSPHEQFGLASDSCAGCHAAHDAQGPMLLQQADPQASACFTCHDGTGALSDVRSDWTSPTLPANDPVTSSYYSHPATETRDHVSGVEDEFAGVLNRHAVCADCHQPHLADGSRPVQTTAGWSVSGAIQAPGVGVTHGAAGTSPAYEWKQVADLEYELCLKCHSGYTTLPANDPVHPSRWALDKAIEINPANTSYHPVAAAGTNQSGAMAQSLLGTSPYKLWNFETDETVRCTSCHGDSDVATPATPPSANSPLDNHSSPNRGILIAPYRDRDLKSVADQYLAEDFGLCYVCHAEAPMVDDSGDIRTDTNFNFHGYHISSIAGNGTGGTDIDTPGAGRGNAICAECHFRTHGTALATGSQAQAPRLVNFPPNVRPVAGVLSFTPVVGSDIGSCTMQCHGKNHVNYGYAGPPP